MKQRRSAVFTAMLCAPLLAFAAEFQSFDGEGDGAYKPTAPFTIDTEQYYSPPHSLAFPLDDKNHSVPIPGLSAEVKPGAWLGVSVNYHTPEAFNLGMLLVFGNDAAGKRLWTHQVRLNRTNGWGRAEEIVRLPDDATLANVTLALRMTPQAAPGFIHLDNLRLEALGDPAQWHVAEFAFADLDSWKPTEFAQERMLFDHAARRLLDWNASKFSESCVAMTGDNHTNQFPLRIVNLKTEPGRTHVFGFHYKTPAGYTANQAMIIMYFRDAEGKTLSEQARLMLPAAAEWKEASLNFETPENAAWMDATIRFLSVPPEVTVLLNRVTLENAQPEVRLEWQINPDERLLTGAAVVRGLTGDVKPAVMLNDGRAMTLDAGNRFSIDLRPLANGRHILKTSVAAPDGAALTAEEVFFNFNDRTWENNDLGKLDPADAAPHPWKNLTVDAVGRKVAAWNPVVSFSPSGALENIVSANDGRALLKEPVAVLLNGRDIFATLKGGLGAPEASAHRVVFSGTLDGDDVSVSVSNTVAYDGMVRQRLDITAKRDITIDSLDVRYRPAVADYLMTSDGGWTNYNIVMLRDEKTYETDRFYPQLWSGDLDAGLYWMAEAMHPARLIQPRPCHRLDLDDGFVNRMVNEPRALKRGETHTLEHAFGATPLRPAPESGRPWRFRAGKRSTGDLMWPSPRNLRYFGFPEAPEDRSILARSLADNADKRFFVYQSPTFAMSSIPENMYFTKKWFNHPSSTYPPNYDGGYPSSFSLVDVGEASWQDLYLSRLDPFLREFRFNGIYFDCVGIRPTVDADGGYAYRVFALRDFLERIYVQQRRVDPASWSLAHVGSVTFDHAAALAEIILTGEHYRAPCMNHRFYLEFLTLEEFRVQNCVNMGPLRMFLPQFRGPKTEAADVATHAMGMVLAHDQYLYPSFIKKSVVDACRDRHYAFIDHGGDNRFLPYWKDGAPDAGNVNVVASAYANDKGELRIYLNATDRPQAFTIKGAAGAAVTLYDPLKDATRQAREGDAVQLEGYMMMMALVGPLELDDWK